MSIWQQGQTYMVMVKNSWIHKVKLLIPTDLKFQPHQTDRQRPVWNIPAHPKVEHFVDKFSGCEINSKMLKCHKCPHMS